MPRRYFKQVLFFTRSHYRVDKYRTHRTQFGFTLTLRFLCRVCCEWFGLCFTRQATSEKLIALMHFSILNLDTGRFTRSRKRVLSVIVSRTGISFCSRYRRLPSCRETNCIFPRCAVVRFISRPLVTDVTVPLLARVRK